MWLLQEATSTIEIASYYWTLRGSESISDPSDYKGTDVYEGLINAHSRGVSIRVVQTIPTNDYQWNDSLALSNLGVIELRSLDLNKLIGAGILHTKLWIVDGQHFYVGSANTDWRALTQVKELGLFGQNCSCLADDALKIFEVYWKVSDPSVTEIPPDWPDSLSADFNMSQPASLPVNNISANIFWASSPPQLSTNYRTDDITALLNVIESATSFVYIAVMNYEPAIIYSKPEKYWPVIDDALRKAAYDKGIEVRLLGSHWNHTSCDMKRFLNSLGSWDDIGRLNGSIETKYFVVPQLNDTFIPFTRVNHNKYMVTDNAAYIGTSNWSGDYFVSTGGVSLISNQTQSMMPNNDSVPIQEELRLIFERDWNSEYSFDIDDVHQPYCSS